MNFCLIIFMTLYNFKTKSQKIFDPAYKWCIKNNLSPTTLTLFGFVISISIGLTILVSPNNFNLLFLVPFLAGLRILFNVLDGMVARTYPDTNHQRGEFLHEMSDRISDYFLFLLVSFTTGINVQLGLFSITLILISSFVGILSKAVGASRRFEGVMGKPERMLLVSIFSVLAGVYKDINIINYMLYVLIFGLILTIIIRIFSFIRETSR